MLFVPNHHTQLFAGLFRDARVLLPTVDTLVVGAGCDFAIQHCPNVTAVAGNGHRHYSLCGKTEDQQPLLDLISAVADARKLSSLEIMAWWKPDLVRAIHDSAPQLQGLVLDAGLYSGLYKHGIAAFVSVISRFDYLEDLAVGSVSQLSVGFRPPRCGNAYRGPGGAEVRKRVKLDREAAEDKVAGMILPTCPKLRNLWIGNSTRVEVLRNEDGSYKGYHFHRGEVRKSILT